MRAAGGVVDEGAGVAATAGLTVGGEGHQGGVVNVSGGLGASPDGGAGGSLLLQVARHHLAKVRMEET